MIASILGQDTLHVRPVKFGGEVRDSLQCGVNDLLKSLLRGCLGQYYGALILK